MCQQNTKIPSFLWTILSSLLSVSYAHCGPIDKRVSQPIPTLLCSMKSIQGAISHTSLLTDNQDHSGNAQTCGKYSGSIQSVWQKFHFSLTFPGPFIVRLKHVLVLENEMQTTVTCITSGLKL